jgi:hypothetical protein
MAIRPVDLQLAYLAAPASAAAANVAQEGPGIAAQSSQAAFAAQLQQREETLEETPRAEGAKIGPDGEGGGNAGGYAPRRRRAVRLGGTPGEEAPGGQLNDVEEHFIDTTA